MAQAGLTARCAYVYGRGLYLNITNRCPVACVFCAKKPWDWNYRGWDLRLAGGEPSAADVIKETDEFLASRDLKEAVFCGFGEPTERLDVLLEVAKRLRKAHPRLRLRLNTVGLGSLLNGRDISAELDSALDAVSVSLNAADPAQWARLHRPAPRWRAKGYAAVLSFISSCAASGLETTVTAVNLPDVDTAAVRALAKALGARFRLRPELRG